MFSEFQSAPKPKFIKKVEGLRLSRLLCYCS